MSKQDLLVSWLQDAHAMEKAMSKKLAGNKKEAGDNEAIQKQREEHFSDSKKQAEKIRVCLREMGADISDNPSSAVPVFDLLQSFAPDAKGEEELIKNTVVEYLTEHFEIAMYRKIGYLADECGKRTTVEMCNQIIIEEEEMAELILENLNHIVSMYGNEQL